MRIVVVVPARMESTRFPGKPLADLCGKPMVQWVYEAALRAGLGARVVVATPNQEIVEASAGFGGEAVLTSPDHETGTDRIAEVAETIDSDAYLNVQGDEPLIDPATVAACAGTLRDGSAQVGSVYCPCPEAEADDPAVVKVVLDRSGFALYFSRYPVPYPRAGRVEGLKKHVGVYAYTKDALAHFKTWPRGALEQAESLEQLRFLENGSRVKMAEGKGTELAVDTPEQAEEVRRILLSRAG